MEALVLRTTLALMALAFTAIAAAPFALVLHNQWRSGVAALFVAGAFGCVVFAVVLYLGTGMASINTGYGPNQPWVLLGLCAAAAGTCIVVAYFVAPRGHESWEKWVAFGLAALFWALFWADPVYDAWESVINL